ncbi:MAG: GxxExxY protein [Gemmatimonadota bacterium]|nr:GxxExxY protein [Gemmatimonadota bacterium]
MNNSAPQRHERAPSEPIADRWSREVIGAAIAVHRSLGPGLLESAYSAALAIELSVRRVPFTRELSLPLLYRGQAIGVRYRLDFLVGGELVIEVKAVERILAVHEAQLLTYLRLGGYRLGLLMNFCAPVLRRGIMRRVLLPWCASCLGGDAVGAFPARRDRR